MSSLNPHRQVLAQFTELMFKRARRGAFISLRVLPDKGSKNAQPIHIDPIRIDDEDFLDIAVIRAEQAANWSAPSAWLAGAAGGSGMGSGRQCVAGAELIERRGQ